MTLVQALAPLALALPLPSAAAGAGAPGATEQPVVLSVAGVERTATLRIPARLGSPATAVVLLHGVGGDGERLRRFTSGSFERAADELGFALVWPDALAGVWSDGRVTGARSDSPDDVAFLRELLAHVELVLGEPLERRFAAGYSDGGQMALRLSLEAPELLDGAAAIAALLPVEDDLGFAPGDGLVPTLLVAGTEDAIHPFAGGDVRAPVGPRRGRVRPALEGAAWLAQRAGHAGEPRRELWPDRDPSDGTRVEGLRWSAPGRPEVALLIVHGGGHALPLPRSAFPPVVGRVGRDVDGAREVLAFFERQGRPAVLARRP